jgi:hypothetical protein
MRYSSPFEVSSDELAFGTVFFSENLLFNHSASCYAKQLEALYSAILLPYQLQYLANAE